MSSEWYMMSRPLFNSGFESTEFDLFAQEGFEEVLASFIGKNIEIYNCKIADEPLRTRAIIQNTTPDAINSASLRQILCRIGTLRCGQYIKEGNNYWMVATLPDNNMMYEKAILWHCKSFINFISPISGEVVRYPVYSLNSTQYGSGETSKHQMTIGTSQHLVYIPYNDETILLDSGFRFLIDKNRHDPTVYRLTQVDSESYSAGEFEGLLQWTIVESQRDDMTDSIELMVADYHGKTDSQNPVSPSYGHTIQLYPDGGSPGVVFGQELKLNLAFFNSGVQIEPITFEATITDGAEYGTIKETRDDYVIIRALNNRDYIGQEITVEVNNAELNATTSLVIRIEGWY